MEKARQQPSRSIRLRARPFDRPVNCTQVNSLVDRQAGIHFLRPGVDPALQVLHLAEAGAEQQLQGARRARAGLAEHDHLLGAVQLGEAGGQLPQRDQRGALEARDLQLVRLAHIQQAQVVALLQALSQLGGGDIPAAAQPSRRRGRARARRRKPRSRSAR